ncbi:PLP-dependent aminotransferase family protein [Brevundimonas alba]|uniref:MocR-like transcription factor YczR n=1 Tax=Brevundimonas alba TaxID=74314 RepID=UPI001439EF4A|nr:PLP-dependent aminotransferase family protein [Brevundimonas alba]
MSNLVVNLNSLSRHLGDWRRSGSSDVAYRRLADSLKGLILDGRLPLNARLPGERRMAEGLGVSRITVSAALDRLRADGFVASRIGSGSYTSLPFSRTDRLEGLFHVAPGPEVVNMATAVMPAGEHVHGAYARALESLPPHLPGHGYDPTGLLPLRRAVAASIAAAGLPTRPDQIVVTSGAQSGWAILLRTFGRSGDAVVIDHPTYPHALDAIVRAGLRPVPVAMTPSGWDIDGLVGTIDSARPRLVYLVGAHQNPTGHVMGADEENAVAEAVARVGGILVMDDTQRELWFDQPPPPPAAPGAHVVRLGSMSKTWWGGLRIGWIRADASVTDAVVRARASLDLGAAVVEQLAAAHLLSGDQNPVIARRRLLAAREAALSAELSRVLPEWRAARPRGGLSLWVSLPRPACSALVVEAQKLGVIISPGTRFGMGGAFERFVRLPYCLPEPELKAAVGTLACAWRGLDERSTRAPESLAEALF